MNEITTRIRIGTVKHDACKLTYAEFRALQKNIVAIATHVAQRLRPEWPVQVTPVNLPVWISVGAGTSEWVEGNSFLDQVIDAVAIADPYDDTMKEDFQPELFAECFLEDPKRAVELYVARRAKDAATKDGIEKQALEALSNQEEGL